MPPVATDRAHPPPDAAPDRFLRVGRRAWSAVGVVAVLVMAGLVASRLSLVIVPLVLALFPAALLEPVVRRLKRLGLAPAVAAAVALVGSLLLLAGVVALLVPVVAAELPDLADSFGQGLAEVLAQAPVDLGVEELAERARELLGEAGEMAGQAVEAATAVVEVVAGLLFGLVVLFFYLKDGPRITEGLGDLIPRRWRGHATAIAGRVWWTVGRYFRGQLLVAFVDAVVIGVGLLVLAVPLAVPLAVLIFFGGLFPIVGAVTTGAVAVLVALADAGLTTALIVLALVIGVQQLEGNILQPVVLGRAIALHPLAVLVAIAAGAVTLGILGAFLAVPIAASIARVVDYVRGLEAGEDVPGPREEPDPAEAMASTS